VRDPCEEERHGKLPKRKVRGQDDAGANFREGKPEGRKCCKKTEEIK